VVRGSTKRTNAQGHIAQIFPGTMELLLMDRILLRTSLRRIYQRKQVPTMENMSMKEHSDRHFSCWILITSTVEYHMAL
jgi:hypothetical protein